MLTQRKLILPDEPKLSGKAVEDVRALYAHLGDIRRALVSYVESLNDEGAINLQDGAIDGTPIGDQEASTGEFTDLTVTGSSTFPTTSSTPTVTASSGTFTTVSASLTTTKVGNRYLLDLVVTDTTNGTAAGVVIVALPFVPAVSTALDGWRSGTGAALSALAFNNSGSGQVNITLYDGTYPGADGITLHVSGVVRV